MQVATWPERRMEQWHPPTRSPHAKHPLHCPFPRLPHRWAWATPSGNSPVQDSAWPCTTAKDHAGLTRHRKAPIQIQESAGTPPQKDTQTCH